MSSPSYFSIKKQNKGQEGLKKWENARVQKLDSLKREGLVKRASKYK